MDPAHWQKLKDIVADALELSAVERAAFLETACGDNAELRRETESMLTQSGARIENFADDLSSTIAQQEVASSRANERLGAYEIVRELGRGGMGAVYLARRADETFEKQVAIKVLKRGTDTDEVLRRFRAERQILARLEHPNIARLLDAGTTDDGLPYFVMERIEGVPITDFCNARGLKNEERIKLFLQICDAIQFAHRNLIVHRDIKPGNILVTAEGQPKLLDFGIAKLLEADGETMLVTIENRQRLTPGYASPEQVRGEAITTVSDVYSLGALLHELLTGRSPHRFATPSPSPTELLHVVGEQEISRTELPGDLDNILRTALRKEPERRYSGVTALADDLRRYLEGRPVQARPATLGYRAAKFIARNKLGAAAALLLLASLIGGMVATTWQARKAQRRFNQVRQLANLFIFKYHDGIAALPGSTELRMQLVNDALDYLNNLSREGTSDPALLRELGTAYKRIADVQGGGVTNPTSGGTVSASNLGDTAGAAQNYENARAIRERLTKMRPNDRELRFELAEVLGDLGQMEIVLGKPTEAAEHFRTVAATLRKMLADTPTDKKVLGQLRFTWAALANVLAVATSNLGDVAGALEAFREANVLGEALVAQEPDNLQLLQALAAGYGDTGRVLMNEGEIDAAVEYYTRAHAIGERLARENPQAPLLRRELAVQNRNLGSAHLERGDKAAALASFRTAVALFEELMAADPKDVRLRRSAAYGYRDLGEALSANGDHIVAEENLQKALRIFDEIAAKDPQNAIVIFQQGLTHLKLSQFFLATGAAEKAHESGERALAHAQQVAGRDAKDVSARKLLAEAHAQVGYCGMGEEARRALGQSVAVWRELQADQKANRADAKKLAKAEQALAGLEAP